MFGTHLSRLGSVHRFGLVPRALAILRSYGADAHVYLPGVGTLNGITAGNYLDSAGTTAATVDNPVGLSLDAAGSVGASIVTGDSSTFTTGIGSWINGSGAVSWASGSQELQLTCTSSNQTGILPLSGLTVGTTYFVQGRGRIGTSNAVQLRLNTTIAYTLTDGPISFYWLATATSMNLEVLVGNLGTVYLDNVTIQPVTGIHATQATTANKPILRLNSGKYSWQFDGSNDRLTTIFSAGTLGANSDVFMVVRRDTVSSTVLAYSADYNNKYIGSCATSGTSAVSSGAGTPTHYVNGVVLSAQTEVAMSAALPAGSTCIVEVQGADLSTWVNFNVGYYAASAAFAFNGQIYDCIICPAMTANERTTIRKYLAQKNGITLA